MTASTITRTAAAAAAVATDAPRDWQALAAAIRSTSTDVSDADAAAALAVASLAAAIRDDYAAAARPFAGESGVITATAARAVAEVIATAATGRPTITRDAKAGDRFAARLAEGLSRASRIATTEGYGIQRLTDGSALRSTVDEIVEVAAAAKADAAKAAADAARKAAGTEYAAWFKALPANDRAAIERTAVLFATLAVELAPVAAAHVIPVPVAADAA